MAERVLTVVQFARARGTSARQVRRWRRDGLPMTTGGKVRVAAAARWLRARATSRGRAQREITAVIDGRVDDVREQLEARVAAHVPAVSVARRWGTITRDAAAVLRAWPATAAAEIAARLRGEATRPPADPRLGAASVAMLESAPHCPIAVALAVQALAEAALAALAAVPPRPERNAEAPAIAAWLTPPKLQGPRARLATWQARASRFGRAVARGEWEAVATVEARWAAAIVTARQRLAHRAPAEVLALPPSATEPEIRQALARAVADALEELKR